MADFGSRTGFNYNPAPNRSTAGTISRIRLENFMCHSNLQIELCPWVNFITGQNGSGKSAILTALCVAFGSRAKGTQRASTLKDFIKTGCSYALVEVEIKNQGEDAFKRDVYGDSIIVERRITASTSSTVLKDQYGKKVASRKEELQVLIVHFNIDVENPCVIMSQDKSREFLHSGNDKDKFKFFFKATLLHRVNDLLLCVFEQLRSANALVDELESTIKPIEKELSKLHVQIKNMEHIEEISQQVQLLKKKLAWSWVYSVDKQLEELNVKIAKLKDRIPKCQAKIDWEQSKVDSLRDRFMEKKTQIEVLVKKTAEVRREQDEFRHCISLANKVKLELEEEHRRQTNLIQRLVKRVKVLEQQIQHIHDQNIKNTQAEETEREEKESELRCMVDSAKSTLSRLKEEEDVVLEMLVEGRDEMRKIVDEIEEFDRKQKKLHSTLRDFRQHKTNKVTAFGGNRVIQLLHTIERHHYRFNRPPIGPIGAHVNLVNGDKWVSAVENAIGKFLNAFIVTNHKDSLVLRACAREANYPNLHIVIYDFSRTRLTIPSHMLPQTDHLTALSAIRSDSDAVLNVLVDMANIERKVLVEDYAMGKVVAFDRMIPNLKEVLTLDGYKMFSRGSVQTVLPPFRNWTPRLCSSYDEQIKNLEKRAVDLENEAQRCRKRKRDFEAELQDLQGSLNKAKERRLLADRDLASKKLALEDLRKSYATETSSSAASNVNEICQEIITIQDDIREKEISLETLRVEKEVAEAKANDLKLSFETLCESAKAEIDAFEEAERELMRIEKDLQLAEAEKAHYESIMVNKVIHDVKTAEEQYRELEENRKESCRKASIICPEAEIEALGGWDGSSPEQLSAQLNRLNQRLQHERGQYSEPIEDLRMLFEKKERKILRKRQTYKSFREKLKACQEALDLRWSKFQRNATLLKRQLTWHFNDHLGKKGISGNIKVSYEEKVLGIEIKMPQDASSSTVRDTRGLSGGERSFSTLCFALALHGMTEAPFRAMDEFDVFMDAVSRKISLDTLVDFAVHLGCQWIFITPHDVSMVKAGEKVKKQQMAAPRS